MSDETSLFKTLGGGIIAAVIAAVGWHNRRLDKLTDKVNECQVGHVKTNEFDRKFDKVEQSIESLRKEIKSDFDRLYDKIDERR